MLVSIPFMGAGMAVDDVAVSGGVELSTIMAAGGHLSLSVLVCG